jgi:hypothetical protein
MNWKDLYKNEVCTHGNQIIVVFHIWLQIIIIRLQTWTFPTLTRNSLKKCQGWTEISSQETGPLMDRICWVLIMFLSIIKLTKSIKNQ